MTRTEQATLIAELTEKLMDAETEFSLLLSEQQDALSNHDWEGYDESCDALRLVAAERHALRNALATARGDYD